MRRINYFMLMAIVITHHASASIVAFDDADIGEPPPGWTATQTGSGTAKWTVEKDETAPSKPNVLKQSGEATYPVCFMNRLGVGWNSASLTLVGAGVDEMQVSLLIGAIQPNA
jgi:hypothetical protein